MREQCGGVLVLYVQVHYWTSFRCNGRTVGDIVVDNIICRARQLSTFDVDVALYAWSTPVRHTGDIKIYVQLHVVSNDGARWMKRSHSIAAALTQ